MGSQKAGGDRDGAGAGDAGQRAARSPDHFRASGEGRKRDLGARDLAFERRQGTDGPLESRGRVDLR
jgi:hypothetical protein